MAEIGEFTARKWSDSYKYRDSIVNQSINLYIAFDLTVAFMIDRDSSVEVENEQSAEEIQALFEHGDFLVHLCSQELGQVVGLADLNHMQSTNNELYQTHEEFD